MATYVVLSLIFLAVVMIIAYYARRHVSRKSVYVTVAALTVLTIVFDNLIISADIVGYNSSKIAGIYLGVAPIEDFSYAIAAAIIVPVLWGIIDRKSKQ